MMKIVLLLALFGAAYAGIAQGGHGQGWGQQGAQGWGQQGGHGWAPQGGHGHGAHGHGHGGHSGHSGGWGRQYQGWANVKSHQSPSNYQYGLQEQGKGYNKWVWQGADAHHAAPVKAEGWQG